MNVDSDSVARELTAWFQSVQGVTDAVLFSILPKGAHRDAVVLDTLRRYGKIVYNAKLDNVDGALYSPLCFFLTAACRYLDASLGVGHWRAALDNLYNLRERLAEYRPQSAAIGLDLGAPATLFKEEFEEAIRTAGLVDGVTFLSKEDRQVAIGLAINWGMRLLLAYALETHPLDRASAAKDLTWLAEQVRQPAAGHS